MHLHIQMRFSGGTISHSRPYVRTYVKICTTASVAILEGLTGKLVVRDRGELRHDHAAVVSEDAIMNQLPLFCDMFAASCICLFTSAMACHKIVVQLLCIA